MKVQFLLAYRYLMGRKTRLILTSLAIAFGVTLLFGMNAVLPAFTEAFRHTMITSAGKVDLTFSSVSNNTFDASAIDKVNGVTGVSVSTGFLQRNVTIPESLGGVVDPVTGSSSIVLTGLNVETAIQVRQYKTSAGRFLQPGDTFSTVVGTSLATKKHLVVGEKLIIPSSEGTAELTVVGILEQFDATTIDEIFVPLETTQRILNLPNQINGIDVLVSATSDRKNVESAVLNSLGNEFKSGPIEVGNELSAAMAIGQKIMSLFGIMALAMSAFVIFNTFRTVVAERRRDFGMLRAVGASRKTVMGLILAEGLIQGILGTLLGLILGYLLALGVTGALTSITQTFLHTSVPKPEIRLSNLIVSILLGMGFTIGSGYFPARSAVKITPLEAIRPESATMQRRTSRRRALVGLVLIIPSILGLIFGNLTFATVSMLTFLVALILLLPIMVKPIADTFGKLIALAYPREGSLAQGNLTRQTSRSAITASALVIGLAVTIAMIGLITSTYTGFMKYLDTSLGADYLLMPSSLVLGQGNLGSNSQLIEELRKIDGISGVTSLRLAPAETESASLQLIGIDPTLYPQISGLEFNSGNPEVAYSSLASERAVIVNGIFSSSSHVKVGDVITFKSPEGNLEYKVVGIAMDYLNAKLATGFISQDNLAKDFHNTTDLLLMANATAGADKEKVKEAMLSVTKNYPSFTLFNTEAFKEEQSKVFKSVFALMYALVAILAIPGLIAMANTMSINVLERTRELGMLRAVGSTQNQVKRMIIGESILLSALGTTIGILSGIFMSIYLLKALVLSGFKLDYYFPVWGILTAIAVGFVFGIIAAWVPARHAAQTNIVEALRYE